MLDLPLQPMLVQRTSGQLHDDESYLYSVKHDGFRAVALIDRGRVRLFSRNGNDMTRRFPELHGLAKGFGRKRIVLDGEIFADDGSVKSFWRLMRETSDRPDISFVAFDLLECRGRETISLAIEERLSRLRDVIPADSPGITIAATFDSGERLFDLAEQHGLEGVVAKRRRSGYAIGIRSDDWLKFKTSHSRSDAPHRRNVFNPL